MTMPRWTTLRDRVVVVEAQDQAVRTGRDRFAARVEQLRRAGRRQAETRRIGLAALAPLALLLDAFRPVGSPDVDDVTTSRSRAEPDRPA
jgi:hypothetical protein